MGRNNRDTVPCGCGDHCGSRLCMGLHHHEQSRAFVFGHSHRSLGDSRVDTAH